MKAAILGTDDYHATMQTAARNALHPQPKIAAIKPFLLPAVAENYAVCSDVIVRRIADIQRKTNCNPRVPYLFLAWFLLGSDNPYRIGPYISDDLKYKQVAILFLRVALGDSPSDPIINTLRKVSLAGADYSPTHISHAVAHAAQILYSAAKGFDADVARHVMQVIFVDYAHLAIREAMERTAAWETFKHAMQKWMYISDEEALIIARQLLFDIVDLKS
jgi:hypothetical protein